MQTLVPGRDFRSSMNSRSHKKKSVGVSVTANDILFGKKLFVLSPFG